MAISVIFLYVIVAIAVLTSLHWRVVSLEKLLIRYKTHCTYSAHVFTKKLASFSPNRIRNWTKGVNIFLKEYVIIPVCTGTHWMLVIVKMNRGDGVSIMILDAANRPSVRSNKIHRRSVERLVKNYLRDEWTVKATLKKEVFPLGK